MKNICSFWIWLQCHVSVKLQQEKQKGEKASGTKKKQLEEHFVTNTESKNSILERQRFSEEKNVKMQTLIIIQYITCAEEAKLKINTRCLWPLGPQAALR